MVCSWGDSERSILMSIELNENNFLMYAIKHYDNPSCSGLNEFYDDLKRFKYLKRLLRKYILGKNLKERLILNHIVVIYNLFGNTAATKMLFYKIDKRFWSQLKTFLVFLNYMPLEVIVSKGIEVKESDIPLDNKIIEKLRSI
jgi:hypothetical protein